MCDSQKPQTAEVALSLCPLPVVMTPADRTGDVGDGGGGGGSGNAIRHYNGYSTQHKPNTFHFHTDV